MILHSVDDIIWQARGRAGGDESTVPVGRQSLAAILRLAELGLPHGDENAMSAAREAIDHIRVALGAEAEQPDPDSTPTTTGGTK